MKRRQTATIFILCLALGLVPARSQDAKETITLTLEECIVRAMENNLNVRIQVLGPEAAGAALTRSRERYYPTLSFSAGKRNTNSPSYSFLEAADAVLDQYDDYTLQVGQTLPYGGTLNAILTNYVSDSNRSFQTINPRYGSTLRMNFSQPLLRNFGRDISRRDIIVARNNLDVSTNQFKKNIMDVIYSVEDAYWNLVYTIETLKVRQQSLDLARDLLEKNRRSVEIGTMAPIEVLSAQAEVATREADILQAEAQVKSAEDRLKALRNIINDKDKEGAVIVPADTPTFQERTMTLDEAVATALARRPDLEATRIGLDTERFNVSYARNQLLPDLSLSAGYWSPGISGDRILYQGGNPLSGIIVGVIPGGFSDALKDALGFRYENWSLSLSLSVPLSNVLSRAAYAQAKIGFEQAALNLQSQEQQILVEIRNAVRSLDTDYKRVQAYKVARELAEQKLAAEEEKLRVGLSTNFLVLTYQRELANARTSELKAIIDYNLSLANIDRALGVSLETRNVKVN
jgi:outer membrane protein TolC